MAITAQEFGIAHVFGIRGTVTSLTVQSDNITKKFALDVEVKDENGRVITDRVDDLRKELDIEGVLLIADAPPAPGDQVTYNSIQYIIKEVDDRGTNMDYRKVSIKGVKYQEIA